MELNQTQWNQLTLNRLMAEINGGELGLKMHDAAAIAEAQERARIFAQTPAQHSTAPAPMTEKSMVVDVTLTEPSKAEQLDKGWVMKKAALIRKHATSWPTAQRDFQDAAENGLARAAKAPGHGEWFVAAALNWADQRGKRTIEKQQDSANIATVWKGKKHTIEG